MLLQTVTVDAFGTKGPWQFGMLSLSVKYTTIFNVLLIRLVGFSFWTMWWNLWFYLIDYLIQ